MAGWLLGELATIAGGTVRGAAERRIGSIKTLAEAGADDLAPLTARRHLATAKASRAGALLTTAELAAEADRDALVAADPKAALVALLEHLLTPPAPTPGVDPTAVLGPGCEIAADARVGAYAVLGAGVRIGAAVDVHPQVVIGDGCAVGEGSVLHPQVVLYPGTRLGRRVIVHAGTVLGSDGFGYLAGGGEHRKVPQVGRLEIGDDVEIGANAAIDRGTLGATVVGAGSKLDNLVQVAHNVEVGAASILCGQAGIAGSTKLGRGVVFGGQAGAGDHLELGDGVRVAGGSAVFKSVAAGGAVAGLPAIDAARWRRQTVLLARLEEMARRLARLEKRDRPSAGAGTRREK